MSTWSEATTAVVFTVLLLHCPSATPMCKSFAFLAMGGWEAKPHICLTLLSISNYKFEDASLCLLLGCGGWEATIIIHDTGYIFP